MSEIKTTKQAVADTDHDATYTIYGQQSRREIFKNKSQQAVTNELKRLEALNDVDSLQWFTVGCEIEGCYYDIRADEYMEDWEQWGSVEI